MMRIKTAHFPAIETLEDFNCEHPPSLRRGVLAHLAGASNVRRPAPLRPSPTYRNVHQMQEHDGGDILVIVSDELRPS